MIPPGYKQTEVGVIPEEWEAKAIGDEIDLLTGFPFPSSGYAKFGIRLLRGSNVKRGQTDWSDEITQYWPAATRNLTRYTMMAGDLVVSMDGSLVGRSYAQLEESDLPALLLQRVARIRATKLDVGYLRQFVGGDQFVKYVDSVKTVTAIPHISPADIRRFTIPVPPTVAEQRAIATALSDVDALLAALDRLIAKKRDLKQAAMQQLLTGQTRLPGFEGEWEDVKAGEVGHFRGGNGFPMIFQGEASCDYPFYKVSDMNNDGNETFMLDSNNWISEGMRKQLGATAAPAGSIIFAKVGAAVFLERKKILTQPSCIDNNLAALVLDHSRAHVRFVHYALLNIKFSAFVSTTALPSLSSSVLSQIRFLLPPLPEQTAIAAVLSDMDAELAALEQRRDKTRALKQGMMQELLTGRTRLVASPQKGGGA